MASSSRTGRSSPSLFSAASAGTEPLAARMRPRTLDEFIGQEHILGPGKLLRRAIAADRLSSLIFAGPPGTGKTTLARVIANSTKSLFLPLNAVFTGVKDIRDAIEQASSQREIHGQRTILFVDEVHRWNKAQQDALLPWVENGTIIMIGATTENPFFEVNPALVSRSRVFQLRPLGRKELLQVAQAALSDPLRGYGRLAVELAPEALEHLVDVASGDARTLLSALELAVETSCEAFPPPAGTTIRIGLAEAEDSIQKRALLYDKDGDYHYDAISAFIKSLRGSDPDAAFYWMARMIAGGEDPAFLFRRMLILAGEDVGLADPQAIVVVQSAAAAFERVGMPEGQYHLATAALYLATCSKSNSVLGYFDALAAVEKEGPGDVPVHLRDGNRDKKGFGHGEGYQYPHAYRDHWVTQAYLPASLREKVFYHPSHSGYEASIREQVIRRRELQLAAMEFGPDSDQASYSPASRQRERWLDREPAAGEALESLRTAVCDAGRLTRSASVLVAEGGSGWLYREALRRCPEGAVQVLLPGAREVEAARALSRELDELERPDILQGRLADLAVAGPSAAPAALLPRHDVIIARNQLGALDAFGVQAFFAALQGRCNLAVVCEDLPGMGSLPADFLPAETAVVARKAQSAAASDPASPLHARDTATWLDAAAKAGFASVPTAGQAVTLLTLEMSRAIGKADIATWYSTLSAHLPPAEASGLSEALRTLEGRSLPWKRVVAILVLAAAPRL